MNKNNTPNSSHKQTTKPSIVVSQTRSANRPAAQLPPPPKKK